MKKTIIKNKKNLILYIILSVIALAIYLFTCNNYSFYKEDIAKVINEESTYSNTTEVTYGYHDDYYKQQVTLKILNGEYKNQEITITNEYDEGLAYYDKYNKNDEVFVSLVKDNNGVLQGFVDGYKRDKYIILISLIFIITIIIAGKKKGLLSIISVIANILIFILIVELHGKGINYILLSGLATFLFSIVSLTIVGGFKKQTLAAIISTLLGIIITMIIALSTFYFTKGSGVRFEQMDLLTRPYEAIFISELMIGGLGAIMDISITITSSFTELINKNKNITKKELFKSGREIGKDVTGTMINVLFFTYICGCICNLVILLRNGISINELGTDYITLEMVRALVGSIGIVVTIPIAILISLKLLRRNKND